VPRRILPSFTRVSLTAATVWATVALFLSIVPSYAQGFIETQNLALLAALAAIAPPGLVRDPACFAAMAPPAAAQPSLRPPDPRRRLLLLVLAAPLRSLALIAAGSLAAGIGHGLAFLNAQQELNEITPEERRGEVTSAFIACIYALVAGAVIGTGLLNQRFSLAISVGAVSLLLVGCALARTPGAGSPG
jgi:hypothetical protein